MEQTATAINAELVPLKLLANKTLSNDAFRCICKLIGLGLMDGPLGFDLEQLTEFAKNELEMSLRSLQKLLRELKAAQCVAIERESHLYADGKKRMITFIQPAEYLGWTRAQG